LKDEALRKLIFDVVVRALAYESQEERIESTLFGATLSLAQLKESQEERIER